MSGRVEALLTHSGGCHCGRVRFECRTAALPTVLDCDCSICRMSGFLHLIVPAAHFRLLQGAENLREYNFLTGVARHLFCNVCGIKSCYVPRSHPDAYDVNVRCLDSNTLTQYTLRVFRDADRASEAAVPAHLGGGRSMRGRGRELFAFRGLLGSMPCTCIAWERL